MQEPTFLERIKGKSYVTGHNIVYAIGCLLMVIASFMPYVNTSEGKLSLMDGYDGIFFLMCAVLMCIFMVYGNSKVVGVLSMITVYLGAYELAHTFGIMSKTGKVVTFQLGYYVLLVGTLIVLSGTSYFIYRHGLKTLITKIYDRFFPVKDSKSE